MVGLRCYRIPFSTNVERVALAAGQGLEPVDVDPGDRSPVETVSGQLVPVLVDGDDVISRLAARSSSGSRGTFPNRRSTRRSRPDAPRCEIFSTGSTTCGSARRT